MSIPKEPPSALTYAWVFSQPPETVIARLRENEALWDTLCEEIGGNVRGECEQLSFPSLPGICSVHYCDGYWDGIEAYRAAIRARGKRNDQRD